MTAELAGILVGGASRRMGGHPKGLLPAPDGSGCLVERLVRIAREAGLGPLLVGRNRRVEAAVPMLEALEDVAPGLGPIGGVTALLRRAAGRPVLLLSCDLPSLGAALLRRLRDAPPAPIVAPRDAAGWWQPFPSRWEPAALPWLEAAIARGDLSLQPLLRAHGVPLELAEAEWNELRDWDSPADIPAV